MNDLDFAWLGFLTEKRLSRSRRYKFGQAAEAQKTGFIVAVIQF